MGSLGGDLSSSNISGEVLSDELLSILFIAL